VRLVVERAYTLQGERVALQGQTVRVRGIVTGAPPGQSAFVRVRQGRRRVASARRAILPVGSRGQFTVEFRARRAGVLRAFATVPGRSVRSRPINVIVPSAGFGAAGLRVRFLQRRLRELRYLVALSGTYDDATARAVLAYRKVNGMARTGTANRAIFARLARKRGRFHVRFPRLRKHAEVDISRQVLALVDRRGRLFRVLHTSTGAGGTPTVLGVFRVYSKTPGTNSHSMLHSNYFIGGYAIHGYPSVPVYPASHGCVRIPNANARFVNRWLKLGDRVAVYR
jgi:peptidoglycan hydrolase-like protein with peptidoglycan-binding domain